MLKKLLIYLVLLSAMRSVMAQPVKLKKVMTLQMPATADDAEAGYNGASVCWHPVLRRYYAAFAGGRQYPMAVFDEKGQLLSSRKLVTRGDIRGLWFNPSGKQLSGNCYNEDGWFQYLLNREGIPTDLKITYAGMHQPDENSTGALDPALKQLFFLDKGQVVYYDLLSGKPVRTLPLHLGRPVVLGPAPDEEPGNEPLRYNNTTAVYTGVGATPIAVWNVRENQLELYDSRQGYLHQILLLPEDAPRLKRFNFACTNGIWWIFDPDTRSWYGYR